MNSLFYPSIVKAFPSVKTENPPVPCSRSFVTVPPAAGDPGAAVRSRPRKPVRTSDFSGRSALPGSLHPSPRRTERPGSVFCPFCLTLFCLSRVLFLDISAPSSPGKAHGRMRVRQYRYFLSTVQSCPSAGRIFFSSTDLKESSSTNRVKSPCAFSTVAGIRSVASL